MPKLTRVNRITHRMFHNFSWPTGVLDFGRFNLIYGWNASGKTTLSSLFRKLERRDPLAEGTTDFVIDGSVCDLTTISAESLLPQVRVFNREFVEANVLSSQLAAIFYLGADSVEKQKQIERLKEDLEKNRSQLTATAAKLTDANTELDKFCIREAKFVKDLLSSSGSQNPYNTYNKANFKDACGRIKDPAHAKTFVLTDNQRSGLVATKESQPKPLLSSVPFVYPDLTRRPLMNL